MNAGNVLANENGKQKSRACILTEAFENTQRNELSAELYMIFHKTGRPKREETSKSVEQVWYIVAPKCFCSAVVVVVVFTLTMEDSRMEFAEGTCSDSLSPTI